MSVLMVVAACALWQGLGTDSWAYQWFGLMIRLTGNEIAALLSGTGWAHVVHYRLMSLRMFKYRYP